MIFFRFMDRLTEPENPFVLRFTLVCATFLYVAGFVWDPAYFSASFGCLFLAWPISEDRAKLKREQRLAAWRSSMAEIERLVWNYAQLPDRMRSIYGPVADCDGMGV